MALTLEKGLTYDQVTETIVEMGNRMLAEDDSADVGEVASGIMAGAVQFWLYSRQPCADPDNSTSPWLPEGCPSRPCGC